MSDVRPLKKAFISYLDDTDQKISGYFDLVEVGLYFVIFKSKGNRISIPANRVLKVKEKAGGEQ